MALSISILRKPSRGHLAQSSSQGRSSSAPQLWLSLFLLFAAVLLSHFTLLRLPYFWDEGGYYVPAALDFFRTGALIPQSTVTNAHPPLPMVIMAGWWKLFGFRIIATRILVCLVSATALLGVFRLAQRLIGSRAAAATTLLTAVYPVWFAQSTLAHADIFAAAFTLWAMAAYFDGVTFRDEAPGISNSQTTRDRTLATQFRAAILFSLAALSKETAIVTPLALAALEAMLLTRSSGRARRLHALWIAALAVPVLPLSAWYGYHRAKTGFIFGNPEFLRYNATANLDAHRILLCLWHRLIHLTAHMNMFVAVLCAIAAALMPAVVARPKLSRPVFIALAAVLIANLLEFSVLGGALLTRYLLPMYPLVILICVAQWQRRVASWGWLAAFSAVAFLAGIWINPPYAFAPEDNLTYRDMIVLHQQAIDILEARYPGATVLTAWPAAAEISRPELGYTARPFRFVAIENFSFAQIQRAAADPGAYDTALLFSTKWAPARNSLSLSRHGEPGDTKYFDFHLDLHPAEAAAILHGEVVWQASRGGEWAALLRFPRIVDARLIPLR